MYKEIIFRLLILPVTVTLSYVTADFASWVFAKLYAFRQGMALESLSEDYFMGFISSILFVGVFIFSAPAIFIFLMKKLKHFINDTDSNRS